MSRLRQEMKSMRENGGSASTLCREQLASPFGHLAAARSFVPMSSLQGDWPVRRVSGGREVQGVRRPQDCDLLIPDFGRCPLSAMRERGSRQTAALPDMPDSRICVEAAAFPKFGRFRRVRHERHPSYRALMPRSGQGRLSKPVHLIQSQFVVYHGETQTENNAGAGTAVSRKGVKDDS